jgi:phosphoglycerate dehydrogenase-like enzyme
VDILLLESLIPEAMAWLEARHSLAYRPQLAHDRFLLQQNLGDVRAMVVPRQLQINREFLEHAKSLEVIARLSTGSDNVDLESCQELGVRFIQARSANVRANAEFMLGTLLLMFRRGVMSALLGREPNPNQLGREINGSTIGLLGMGPSAHTVAYFLNSMGARVIGYDPALHHTASLWQQLRVQPVSMSELVSTADAVLVQMIFASRYRSFVSERALAACKHGQVWISNSRSGLFDAQAMADALRDGRISSFLMDGADENFAGPGSPLNSMSNFFLTPRLGSKTREARVRASWHLANTIHDALTHPTAPSEDTEVSMHAPLDLALPLGMPGESAAWPDSTALPPSNAPPVRKLHSLSAILGRKNPRR